MAPIKFFKALLDKQEGATAVEYGLIAGCISVLIIVVLQTIGTQILSVLDSIIRAIATALAP